MYLVRKWIVTAFGLSTSSSETDSVVSDITLWSHLIYETHDDKHISTPQAYGFFRVNFSPSGCQRKRLRLRRQLPVEHSRALSGVMEEHIAITTMTISNSWHIHVQVRKVDIINESIHSTSLTLPASRLFFHISATKSRYITTQPR